MLSPKADLSPGTSLAFNKDSIPDSKVYGANMGPIWGRQDPYGPHVGLINLAIWDSYADTGYTQNVDRDGFGTYISMA